jgi:hypothetical protein
VTLHGNAMYTWAMREVISRHEGRANGDDGVLHDSREGKGIIVLFHHHSLREFWADVTRRLKRRHL